MSGTKVAVRMKPFEEDVAAWEDVMVLLRNIDIVYGPKWPDWSKRSIMKWLFGLSMLCTLAANLPASGRNRIFGTMIASISWLMFGWWMFYGWNVGGDMILRQAAVRRVVIDDDAASVVSSSAQLREENEGLRRQLLAAQQAGPTLPPLPPPPGAPPLPNNRAGQEPPGAPVPPLIAPAVQAAVPSPESGAANYGFEQARINDKVIILSTEDIARWSDCTGTMLSFGRDCCSILLNSGEVLNNTPWGRVRLAGVEYPAHRYVAPPPGIVASSLLCHVCLRTGASRCERCDFASCNDPCSCGCVAAPLANQVYAPVAGSPPTQLKAQAARIKDVLIHAYSCRSALPNWPLIFWSGVTKEHGTYGLQPELVPLLQTHGWVGNDTKTAPRFETLRKELSSWESMGAPSHGAAAHILANMDDGEGWDNPEAANYHLRLPPDLQRAGPEVYRSMRAEGYQSIRAWVNDQFPLDKRSLPQYAEMFTSATQVDFAASSCKTESALMRLLSTSDQLEIELRKLASFVHARRTGDRQAALHMLAIRPPGMAADVAPNWLVDEASLHSKYEFQRTQRGSKGGGGGGKGDGTTGGGGGRKGESKGTTKGGGHPAGKAKARKGDAKGADGTQG